MLSKEQYKEFSSIFKKHFTEKYCLHPDAPEDCAGGIIKAHTVQRSGGISNIAKDGKVYVAKNDIMSVFNSSGKIEIKLVGLNEATTFFGFCQKHDCELFSPIEKSDFIVCDEHCFLIGYRALCKELYVKNAAILINEDCGQFIDFNNPIKRIQYIGKCRADDISRKEVFNMKTAYDSILKSKIYDDVKFLSIELQHIPPVLCSAYVSISKDMYGNTIQDQYGDKTPLRSISYSIISRKDKGFVVFQWHKSANRIAMHVLQQILLNDSSSVSRYIIGLVFLYAENFAFSPLWWEKMSVDTQKMLLNFVNDNIITEKGLGAISKWNYGNGVVLKSVSTNFNPLNSVVSKINRNIAKSNQT